MRPFLLLLLLAANTPLWAQPGDLDLWTDRCFFPAAQTVDLTGDSIPDVSTCGLSVGTDDVPSSFGTCTWGLQTLAGTHVLHRSLDGTMQHVLAYTDQGILGADALADDLRTGRAAWATAMLPVMHWSYGGRGGTPNTLVPELMRQVFVLRTEHAGRVLLTSIRLHFDPATWAFTVETVDQVPEGMDLRLRP